ncbi:MAG: pseudouridine-5'-phosphate glycosidase [Gemmatimonadaceae bacterium]
MRLTPEVAAALRDARAVVALESSVLAQGLPFPANREACDRMLRAVRERGAVPAITAVARGVPTAGLEGDDLERFLRREGVRKLSARDLGCAIIAGADGATTVAAALVLAREARIEVFATGGIGGVHRWPSFDESADLLELARTPAVVVCAGAKSILDLEATSERLETLGIPVLGYGTNELPGFFTRETGIPLSTRVDSPAEVAAIARAHRGLGLAAAVVVMQPPPADVALPRQVVDAAVRGARERAEREGIRGSSVTPFLLAEVERETGGRSLGANLALLEANAGLAAQIAVELCGRGEVRLPREEGAGGRGGRGP